MYRDGGRGALRPVIIRLGGGPVPGICAGLQDGLKGMRVGGRRTFTVPASLGFGGETVLGPYGEDFYLLFWREKLLSPTFACAHGVA